MSKSIQERLKQLENTFRACCNKLFKLIERVDNLEIEVSEGIDLNQLTDVTITDVNENQVLLADSEGNWINKSVFDAIDSRTSFGNTNYTIISTDRFVSTSVIFTAPRTVTLPLANSVNKGHEIIVADGFGAINGVNTLIITRSGANLINGATSETIAAPFGMRRFISDGSNSWSFDGGVARLSGAVFTGNIEALNFKSSAIQDLTGLVWTGTTAPSGTADLKYRWTQKGKEVTLIVSGMYSVAGSALTQVRFPLPADLPVPARPAGIAAVSTNKCYIGSGHLTNSLTLLSTATTNTYIVVNSADTSKFDVVLVGATAAHLAFYGSITYYIL